MSASNGDNGPPVVLGPRWVAIFAVVFVAFVAVQGVSLYFWFFSGTAGGTLSEFGDLVGGVNALFTGLAFVGLIYTLRLQHLQLESSAEAQKAQQGALAQQQEALKEQTKALKEQAEALKEQAELRIMATLVDIYTRQIDVMEQGGLRGRLWAAKQVVMGWGRDGRGEPQDIERAVDKGRKSQRYKEYDHELFRLRDAKGKDTNQPDPLFRTSFDAWIHAHRNIDHVLPILEEGLKNRLDRPIEVEKRLE